ncbi:MAG: diguanylate cyclase [Clostridia bacterium]|nr:diguanylate cyclase [Clostridia bacterium]
MDNFYKQMLEESPVGYAYHKIHLDASGLPCDYEFIEVNTAFETLTGLNRADIIGKKVSEVLLGIKNDKFDWINIYGDIAINGEAKEFEHYFEQLQRSYRVQAYLTEKNYFIIQFTESINEIVLSTDLKIMLEMSDELLQLEKGKDINYQNITDCLKQISRAIFVVFNVYEDDGEHYHTTAISGDKGAIKKAQSMLGLDLKRIRWKLDSAISARVKAFTVTKFDSLEDFAGEALPIPIVRSIEKILKLGELVFIRIAKGKTVLGDFQMLMKTGETFNKKHIVEIFAKQIGNAIERSRVERDLIQSEQQFKFLFENSGLGIGFYTIEGTIVSFNKQAIENMGGLDEYEGKSLYDLFPKANADVYMGRILKASKTDSPDEYIDFVPLKSGNKWFSSIVKRITNHDGEALGVQIISQDITERISAEKDLKTSENRFREVLQSLETGVVVHDMGSKIIDCNRRAEEMLGLSKQQLLGIDAIDPRWVFLSEAGVQIPHEEYPVTMVLNSREPIKEKILGVYDPNNATTTWVSTNGTPIYNQMGEIEEVVISFIDITERKNAEQIMINLSYYDQLTGLYNRRFYEEELKRLDKERNLPIALIMLDVNGLKLTNDAFGHQAGDVLLKKIAELLKNECRSDEIISRIGGDEFVILLPKTDAETAKKLIQRISIAMNKEQIQNSLLSLSIGFAVKDSILKQFYDTFKEAEDDMYRHKLTESTSFRSKSIEVIMNSLYEKSSREMNHSKRVSYLCEQIASNLNFNEEEIRECRVAGLVHDIGKMGVSNTILDKDGKLTNEEWAEMKKHSEMGYRILSSVIEFSEIAEYVLSHQERWDGKGYPQGLKGEQIPTQSRIIAVADAFDAMTVDRTYRKNMNEVEAIQEIRKCAGTQFDPSIAKIFVEKVLGKTW